MKFWEDMQSKWGFSDGDARPDGAEKYREVYIETVNLLAKRNGSEHRAIAFDRAGLHNSCLILFYKAQDLEALKLNCSTDTIDPDAHPKLESLLELDEAMKNAIQEASELELDDYVYVSVEIADHFSDFLEELENPSPPDTAL